MSSRRSTPSKNSKHPNITKPAHAANKGAEITWVTPKDSTPAPIAAIGRKSESFTWEICKSLRKLRVKLIPWVMKKLI